MCSTVAGFLVAGGKAIFINSSAPSLWKWACGPERKKDVLKDFRVLAARHNAKRGNINSHPGGSVRKFLHDHVDPGVFAPDAVRTLIAAFDGAWQSILANGARLSAQQS